MTNTNHLTISYHHYDWILSCLIATQDRTSYDIKSYHIITYTSFPTQQSIIKPHHIIWYHTIPCEKCHHIMSYHAMPSCTSDFMLCHLILISFDSLSYQVISNDFSPIRSNHIISFLSNPYTMSIGFANNNGSDHIFRNITNTSLSSYQMITVSFIPML